MVCVDAAEPGTGADVAFATVTVTVSRSDLPSRKIAVTPRACGPLLSVVVSSTPPSPL
jgi:hypothetical protein